MSWREDYLWKVAGETIGPGYGWAGGKFGRLLTTVIRWAGAALAAGLIALWFKDGGSTFSSKSTSANSAHAERPSGDGF